MSPSLHCKSVAEHIARLIIQSAPLDLAYVSHLPTTSYLSNYKTIEYETLSKIIFRLMNATGSDTVLAKYLQNGICSHFLGIELSCIS